MNTPLRLAITIILSICAISFAEPIPVRPADQIDLLTYTPPQNLQDQMVIQVHTNTQAQLDAMLDLVESVWSEHTGIGQLDIQIKQSNLKAITNLGIPHEILIEDLQAHTNDNWAQMAEIERLNPYSSPAGTAVHDDLWFANYKQLNEITDYINNIATLRPDLATTSIIGQSWEARDMFAITITAPDSPENPQADRPAVFIFSTVHAREWIAPMTTSYFASKFVEDYDTNPRIQAILDSTRIVIVPVANPDGYHYTWTNYRMWRKTRRDNGGSFGIDMNRNWAYAWGGAGSSGNPSSNIYRGTAPFSEPETSALRDVALSFGDKLAAHIDYHSYSQLILYPFGYANDAETPEPDKSFFHSLCRELSTDIKSLFGVNYIAMQSKDLYPAAGDASDWFYGQLGVASVTFELRTQTPSFGPPPENILPNGQENYFAFQRYVERINEPVTFWFTPPQRAESDTPTPVTIDIHDGLAPQQPTQQTLWVRTAPDQSFSAISMADEGTAGKYIANLPATPCGTSTEYYFQATRADGTVHTYPSDGPTTPLAIVSTEIVTVHTDDLEAESGWTVGDPDDTATAGIWNRMDPQEVSHSDTIIAQPENDHTLYGTTCWVTDGIAGVDDNDRDLDGLTTLTSPTFNLSLINDPYISFWFWLYRSDDRYPSLKIDLSNDNGVTWKTVDYLDYANQYWTQYRFRIADELEPTNQVLVRFVAFDNGPDSVVEVAIDDLKIEFYGCPTTNPADLNNDGMLDFTDVSIFINAFAAQNPISDMNNDGTLDFFDVSEFLLFFSQGMP